jgi:hypothetical protein
MDKLAQLGLLAGYIWGTAGLLAYPGVSWKPGALLATGAVFWLIAHDALPDGELIEGLALLIFVLLAVARQRLGQAAAGKKSEGDETT